MTQARQPRDAAPDALAEPEIVAMVQHVRDRYGLAGLEVAAALIHEEMVRTAPILQELAEPEPGAGG